MKCPKCAGLIKPEEDFCTKCGHSLRPIKTELIIYSLEDDDEEFVEDFLIVELTDDEEERI
jgi:rRNA maturation endonuclease Nob1